VGVGQDTVTVEGLPAPTQERGKRTSSAVAVYVIVLVAFQVFLITVAVEAFFLDEEGLAWATAAVSVVVAAGAALFLRWLRP
jgi:hypothetical protein